MMIKWGLIAGVALFAALMGAAVIPALFPQSAALAAPLLCAGGEMTTESQTFYPEPGRTVIAHSFFCVEAGGARRELSSLLTVAACTGMGFLPAFLVLALMMGRSKLEMLPDTATPLSRQPESADGSFNARLAELARARDAGLISPEEFEQKKKDMLNSL